MQVPANRIAGQTSVASHTSARTHWYFVLNNLRIRNVSQAKDSQPALTRDDNRFHLAGLSGERKLALPV
jgi:hypothetical protein